MLHGSGFNYNNLRGLKMVSQLKATKEQFDAYMVVRASGKTNMFDVARVIKLAKQYCEVRLNRDECLDIMHNFSDYKEQYENQSN
jgi:hypothetical protein